MKTLVIDIGGNNIKILATGQNEPRKTPSGPELTPTEMVRAACELAYGWDYETVSIGYPGVVKGGRLTVEPHNLGPGWVDFNMAEAFGCPVKLINDAAMQALGSYRGGCMLFLGLGTGLGCALVSEGVVVPMELAHLGYKKATFEDYVGKRGMDEFGKKKWRELVFEVVQELRAVFNPDEIVLGGGNVKKLKELPADCRLGGNSQAFLGGMRLWDPSAEELQIAPKEPD